MAIDTSLVCPPTKMTNSARAAQPSPTQASQSMPVSFQEVRYLSAAACVAEHWRACEQLFIGMCVRRIGIWLRTASRSYSDDFIARDDTGRVGGSRVERVNSAYLTQRGALAFS